MTNTNNLIPDKHYKKLAWFEDPAHGWLRVPLALIGNFKPSVYSYYNKTYAYLEEDCDAGSWLHFHNYPLELLEALPSWHTDKNSFIRRLNYFKKEN